MNNPILQMLNNPTQSLIQPQNNAQGMNNIPQMINSLRNAQNPNGLINMMAQQNPQLQQVMNLVNQSGRSPKDLFLSMAQQKGIDPNQILNMLK